MMMMMMLNAAVYDLTVEIFVTIVRFKKME